jgi:hypothetical protein
MSKGQQMADSPQLRFDKAQQDAAAQQAIDGANEINKIKMTMTAFVNDFKARSLDSTFAARADRSNAEIDVQIQGLLNNLKELALTEQKVASALQTTDQES